MRPGPPETSGDFDPVRLSRIAHSLPHRPFSWPGDRAKLARMEFFDAEFWAFLWDAERYEALVAELGPSAPLLAVVAMIIVSFLPLPAETVAVANGMAFGQWAGFALTWLGAMIAALIAFCLARWLGQPIINRILPARMLDKFERQVERRGAPFLFFVRMIPLVPYTVVNYGSGLSPVRLRTYLWTSAIGMAPPIFAFVSAGAMMKDQPWLGWVTIGAIVVICALLAFYTRSFWSEKPAG